MPKALDENDKLRGGVLVDDPSLDAERMQRESVARSMSERLAKSTGAEPGAPNDLASEAAMLASLLWASSYGDNAVTVLTVREIVDDPGLFYSPAHGAIYGAMLALYDRGVEFDATSLNSELASSHRHADYGGIEYLETLLASATACSHGRVRDYATRIRDRWARRQLLKASKAIAERANDLKSSSEGAMVEAQNIVTDIAKSTVKDAAMIRLNNVLAQLTRSLTQPRKESLKTHFRELDEKMSSLCPRMVTIVAARTSMGKSALSAQISMNIARANPSDAVAYFTLEMPATQFMQRAVASMAGIEAAKIMNPERLSRAEISKMFAQMGEIGHLRLYFQDSIRQTVADIHRLASRLRAALSLEGVRLAMIAIDHISLVRPPQSMERKSKFEQVAETSAALRWLAEEHDCHVLALTQMNRDAAKRGLEAIPQIHEIKNSGNIEEDADNVLILHRDLDEMRRPIPGTPARLVIAKQRYGATGVVPLKFEPEYVRFSDWDGEPLGDE